MKILIDIGHPAHVHYFRNFISLMEKNGHEFLITARDKEVTFNLLDAYKIPYKSRGKGGKGFLGKIIYLFKGNFIIYKAAKIFKPDLFLSFASPYAAQISVIFRRPHIALDDTEHSIIEQTLYIPFSSVIITPHSFKKYLGQKHIKINSYFELCYLHPNVYTPKKTILSELNLVENEYVILRFVSWNAAHDFGQSGLSVKLKKKIIEKISSRFKVIISSEFKLPAELNEYSLKTNPTNLHDLLYYSRLCISEGATTASECSVLGTPNIYVNSIKVGYLEEQIKIYGLGYSILEEEKLLLTIEELLTTPDIKEYWQEKRIKMLTEKIDFTHFLTWFVGCYPSSVDTMRFNPETQLRYIMDNN